MNEKMIVPTPPTKAVLLEYAKDNTYFPILFPTEKKAMKMHLHSPRCKESVILHDCMLVGLQVEFVEFDENE